MEKVICKRTNWMGENWMIEGKEYELVKHFFYNGEGHIRVKDDSGKKREAPDCFFNYV